MNALTLFSNQSIVRDAKSCLVNEDEDEDARRRKVDFSDTRADNEKVTTTKFSFIISSFSLSEASALDSFA